MALYEDLAQVLKSQEKQEKPERFMDKFGDREGLEIAIKNDIFAKLFDPDYLFECRHFSSVREAQDSPGRYNFQRQAVRDHWNTIFLCRWNRRPLCGFNNRLKRLTICTEGVHPILTKTLERLAHDRPEIREIRVQ